MYHHVVGIMLEMLIPSGTRVQLLTLFLLNPGSEYHIREIGRIIGKDYAIVRKELANLESFGLLKTERKGNQIFFMVNEEFFLYKDLQHLVLKTEGIAYLLKDMVKELGEISCLFIYGSFASGKAGKRSDIDLFIVGSPNELRLITLLNECEQKVQRPINYTLMTRQELVDRRERSDSFIQNVMNGPKIMILGDCTE